MRDTEGEPLDAALALRTLAALVLGVAGWTVPWNLPARTWYDVPGFVICLGALGLWFSLHRALGNLTIVAVLLLGLRVAFGVVTNEMAAPIGGAYTRTLGIAGVVLAATILRIITLPAVVSWFLRRTRNRR